MESFITLNQIWLHSQSTPNNFPLFREENIWRQLSKIHFSANLSLETSENKQTTKKVPPIRRWDCVSANLKAVSSTKSDRFGKNHGKENSLGENQVFFCVWWVVWFMSSCKMLLTGCFEWSNGIWKNALMEEISNKLCSPHAPQVQNFLWKHQLLSFSLHFAFYRVFPNHKGFQSNDHLGYIAPIMPHRSNIKYIFVQPSSSLKNKPNKYLMVVSRRVLRQLTLRAFL